MENLHNRVMRRRRAGETGFTLIELLVVVAVLAILGAIVIFNVTGVANRGKAAACTTDQQTLQSAVDAAISDAGTGGLPTGMSLGSGGDMKANGDLTWLASNGYIHSVPTSCSSFTLKQTTAPATGVAIFTVTGQ
ncbi:MAG: prepilin-type N-terminal cleavage/methylation domain-containing protein [Candidatus Dormibacteraeota bacterium]|nr:prepilin-type N-terminal cleavage/methylation domain-containing protein [Candidatus Dormibacteraeota bacterium]MBV9526332.1 prepilin-type N-terminal cleavage/methylation domain-containing protein [Candidatus Dormibacteraeota bacterium]